MITVDTLRKFAPKIKNAELHAVALENARLLSTVTTARRLCHFMGQIFVETNGFTTMEENLNYTNPERLDAIFSAIKGKGDASSLIAQTPRDVAIANRVYANRLGNGDEASGDGWMYRGSGYKQLTGRSNYREIGEIVGIQIEKNPELARQPANAARIAFTFWDKKSCSELADNGDVEGITEKINGAAKLGLNERRTATLKALAIWK
ncbi:glycoside hydrolase family 19 protein [Chitinibacter sp. S2-10]|uniref:glycoside hydrolase family 19 protein n=1 Tax=Chitinibacter sp. S2-10 TaxID=3373597 RepID=UPI00397740F9